MERVEQRYRGISGDGKGRRISYIVTGTPTEQTALSAVEAVAPVTYATFPRENMSVTEVKKPTVDSEGFPDLYTADGVYYVDVQYARNSTTRAEAVTNKDPESSGHIDSFSFEVGVEDQHFVYPPQGINSAVQRAVGRMPGESADPNGTPFPEVVREGLNYQGRDKGYEGISLPMPRGSFALTYYPSSDKVSDTIEAECVDLVGKVNSVAFWGLNPGEVRCVSCTGQGRNTSDWEISFQFRIQRNKSTLDLGNGCVLSNVAGWDYVDVEYLTTETDDGAGRKTITKVLRQATVWQVFERLDFYTTLRKLA